jgi:hypothetical protein
LTETYSLVIKRVRTDRFDIQVGTPISDGFPGPGAGNIETPGARDVYTFAASPGQRLHVEVLEASAIPQVRWQLTDEAGEEIFATCMGCSPASDLTLERGGTYTLTVGGGPDIGTGTYQMTLREP